MRKRPIPAVPAPNAPRAAFDSALKENVELLVGQRGGRIAHLTDDATLADVVAKVNEILDRLQ